MKPKKLKKLKFAALAGLLAVSSVPSFAGMAGATSGNGELLLNLRYYTGSGSSGGDDISALFDLGVTMDSFLVSGNTPNFMQTWNLNSANYGTALPDFLAFVDGQAGANRANIEFNVIALDNTGNNDAGGARYLTTFTGNTFPSLSNSGLRGFDGMDAYVTKNNVRGTHGSVDHGASIAVQADASAVNPVYFGAVNGPAGDTWRGQTSADTTAKVGVEQNFYFLTTSSTSNTQQAVKQAFGFDMNGDGVLKAADLEYSKFKFELDPNGAPVALTFMAPVPEPESYALMLVGLGMVATIVRRRSKPA